MAVSWQRKYVEFESRFGTEKKRTAASSEKGEVKCGALI